MSLPCYSSSRLFPSCSRSFWFAGRRRYWGRERYLELSGACPSAVLGAGGPASTRPLGPYCSSWQSRKTFSTCPRRRSKNSLEPARLFSEPHGQLCQRLPLQIASHHGLGLCLHRGTALDSTVPLSPQNPGSCPTSAREPGSPRCTQGSQSTCEL